MNIFDLNWAVIVTGIIKITIILVITIVLIMLVKNYVPKIIKVRIPIIQEESSDQLAARSKTLSRIVVQVITAFIWVISVMIILSQLGIDIGPILASVGVASLAIGFAAQNIIRDYLHGFFIIMEDWYRVGEVAMIAGTGGLVEKITMRRTILRDLNGTVHIFPNSQVEKASNLTRDWARINLNISVAYKENLARVITIINEICQQFKEDPAWGADMLNTPHVERVDNLGDSGIDIKILGDTKPIRQWALMGELRKRIKDRFDEEGIEIPWPHTMLYFGNALLQSDQKNN